MADNESKLDDLEVVVNLLADFGVRSGSDGQREVMARRALRDGLTVDDCEYLMVYFTDMELWKGMAQMGAIVANVMAKRERWASVLDAARRQIDRRKRQVEKHRAANLKPTVNMPLDVGDGTRRIEAWERHFIQERHSEGKPPEWLAEHLGIPEAQVREILGAGLEQKGGGV